MRERRDDMGLFGLNPAPAAAEEAAQIARTRRRKLWELEERLHCPVMGTCLDIEDLKKLARKEGFNGKSFDHYRLHVEAVSASCSRNSAAEMMHRLLERKYARWVRIFDAAKTDEAVRRLWIEHLARGEVAGAMWAALTHKAVSKKTVSQVHGDVHMLSHQVGAGLAVDVRRLKTLEEELARLQHESRQQARRASREISERAERIRFLEEENRRQRLALRELPSLKARAEALESGQVVVDLGRRLLLQEATNTRLEESLQKARQQNRLLENRLADHERLQKQLDAVTSERDVMERLLFAGGPGLAEEGGACNGDCRQCEDRLKGRCVLCVGGRTTLLPQYRELAERAGVRLIHHDGGQEEAMSRLPELLAASDAVICPTDCVSHNAYYQLKRHCKAHGKPCIMTRSSGVAGFAMALTCLAEGKNGISAGWQFARQAKNL